jgi:regulator of replication initiation timing
MVETINQSLNLAITEFYKLKKENKEVKERIQEIQETEKQTKINLETNIMTVKGRVTELEKMYSKYKNNHEKERSELFGKVRVTEIETEATKQQIERLRNERQTLTNLHKEQKHTCMNFFTEAIRPLQAVSSALLS